jgi:hypothetical protein
MHKLTKHCASSHTPVDSVAGAQAVSMNGIELQDREFFAAIRDESEPNGSVHQVLPCYEVLHGLAQQLGL